MYKKSLNPKFKIYRTLSEPSAKDERRMSEGSAKESPRAGTAEYVTNLQRRIKACAARTEG